jgi:hypothetical protein
MVEDTALDARTIVFPVWSFAVVVSHPDGGFTILY